MVPGIQVVQGQPEARLVHLASSKVRRTGKPSTSQVTICVVSKYVRLSTQLTRATHSNWSSCFSQSAWTWDEKTQEYYLHLFAIEQPDLNWSNDECRHTIYRSAMEFWLERGVNGFRVDTVNMSVLAGVAV